MTEITEAEAHNNMLYWRRYLAELEAGDEESEVFGQDHAAIRNARAELQRAYDVWKAAKSMTPNAKIQPRAKHVGWNLLLGAHKGEKHE